MSITTDYKIRNFNEQTGQLMVQFEAIEHMVPIDLHLDENGNYPEGEALDTYIRAFCPIGHLQRIEKINNGVSNAHKISALVEPLIQEEPDKITEVSDGLTESERQELGLSIRIQKILSEYIGATV